MFSIQPDMLISMWLNLSTFDKPLEVSRETPLVSHQLQVTEVNFMYKCIHIHNIYIYICIHTYMWYI